MLKTFLFLIKISLFAGFLIFLAEQEGSVEISWLGYDITVHIGLFLGALSCVLVLAIFLYRVLRTFIDFPKSYRTYSARRAKDLGYRALTLGLSAVAAGDTKAAVKQAQKARDLMPDDQGLPLLLQAQSARLDGREDDAAQAFMGLLENKDTAFMGARGLLQASMDRGDDARALVMAREALALHPKQSWILKTVYDLEIATREWDAAQETLKRAVKAGAIDKTQAISDRVAMALAIALSAEEEGLADVAVSQYRKARKLDPAHIPAIILQAEYMIRSGHVKKAKTSIETAWKKYPHAAFVELWDRLMPLILVDGRDDDALEKLQWYERLIKLNANNARIHVVAGKAACAAALWGEARQYFETAQGIRPSKELYKALARLEEKTSMDEVQIRAWLEKAAEAPRERTWICRQSKAFYPQWQPIATPHGAFNTIEWAYPDVSSEQSGVRLMMAQGGHVLEAPVSTYSHS